MWVDKEFVVVNKTLDAEFKFGSATPKIRTKYKPMPQSVFDDGITLVFIDCHVLAIYNLESVPEEFQ